MSIQTIGELEELVPILKSHDLQIVTTNGSYDLIHSAHIRLLKKAKELGDVLIVLLNSDDSVRRNKDYNRPIIPENDRAYFLSELKPVDYVVIFPQDKPLEYLERIKPQIHVKGGTWLEERINEEKEFVAKWNCEYKTFELEESFSSSNIINKILDVYKK